MLRAVASAADAVEIGVPFSDPMADGVTIQRSSQHAIEHGVSLTWILDELARRDFELDARRAADELSESAARVRLRRARAARASRSASAASSCRICRTRKAHRCAAALEPHGLALVQLVTPATPPERLRRLCAASQGFVYAVTRTGITGGESALPPDTASYLAAVKAASHAARLRRLRRAPRGAGRADRRSTPTASSSAPRSSRCSSAAPIPAVFLRSLRT